MAGGATPIAVSVPAEQHHRGLISCQVACPVHTDARGYIRAIAAGDLEQAYLIARGPNPLASICGRVCGAPCEVACRRGKIPRTDGDGALVAADRPVSIRALKRFACESAGIDHRAPAELWGEVSSYLPAAAGDAEELAALLRAATSGALAKADGESIGIVGAGPAGLAAAHDLALMGFRPVVYEAEPVPAGMLHFGVPAYRLPRELIAKEVEVIRALGVDIRCDTRVGSDVSFAELRRRHAAVLLAVGAKRPRLLGLPGEAGPGVLGGVDFLRAVALGEQVAVGGEVVVIGGGNVAYDVARTVVRQTAFDAARTAARLSPRSRVCLVSLETLEEMPADTVEIREGDEEGVERVGGLGPLAIERDDGGRVRAVRFQRCLRVYDESRRFAPVFDPADVVTIECDTVLLATGQTTDLAFLADGGEDVAPLRPGWPKVDPQTLATSAPGVFAAGDLAHGTRLVIDAVASGKKAARSIYAYVTGRTIAADALTAHLPIERYRRERGYEAITRQEVPTLDAEARRRDPTALVEIGYDPAAARAEAARCLDCAVTPVFDGSRCVLCGGCADVCPTLCLKLVALADLAPCAEVDAAIAGAGVEPDESSAILKDEDRCIRCGLCAQRCPVDAISMERVTFTHTWRSS